MLGLDRTTIVFSFFKGKRFSKFAEIKSRENAESSSRFATRLSDLFAVPSFFTFEFLKIVIDTVCGSLRSRRRRRRCCCCCLPVGIPGRLIADQFYTIAGLPLHMEPDPR